MTAVRATSQYSGTNLVRILVADDHELVRCGIVTLLQSARPNWLVVAEAATAEEAIRKGTATQPDVAVLDLSLPDSSGLEVAERLLAAVPGIRIVVLTMHAASPIASQLRRLGVSAYLVKSDAPKALVNAIEGSLAGEAFVASEAARRPASEVSAPDFVPAQFLLTPREIDVLRLLAQDKSNKQVAAALDMSVRTAETHHANILAKLNVETLADVVRIAIRDKLI